MKFKFYLVVSILISACIITQSCKPNSKVDSNANTAPVEKEVPDNSPNLSISIDGRLLKPWNDAPEIIVAKDKRVEETRNQYLAKNNLLEPYIAHARAFVNNGRIENAIKICDKGLEKFPNNADLLVLNAEAKFKGRQLNDAIDNAWDAGKSLEGKGNNIGVLKLTGKDSSFNYSLGFKNYLTLALAMQCLNDQTNGLKMIEIVSDFCTNPDLYTVANYYQYQFYSRTVRVKDAQEIAKGIEKTKPVLAPAKPYLHALLFWKGDMSEADLVDVNNPPSEHSKAEEWIIKAYAVAIKALNNNDNEKAKKVLMKIVTTGFWDYYPYILAEKELAAMGGVNYQEPETINLNAADRQATKKKK